MDGTLLASIIGGTFTIIAAVVGPLASPYVIDLLDSHQLLNRRDDRHAALIGRWSGDLHQHRGVVRTSRISSCELKKKQGSIQGEITIESALRNGKPYTMFISLKGKLKHDRFFKADYIGRLHGRDHREVVQFGCILLELSTDAITLNGAFVGVGPLSGCIVDGTIGLTKEIKK